MHYGDLFYVTVGVMVYLYTWPDPQQAKEWPTLQNFAGGWACMVLLRNLAIEVPFYEVRAGCMAIGNWLAHI